jgi:hypothetical protein
MRTQFFFGGLLSVVAGTLVTTAGCDDVTAGQPSDTAAPPQLVHVMVQDARYLLDFPNRGSSLDILDNYQPAPCTKAVDTCINEFLVDQLAPDVSCTDAGVCGDPFKIPATGVPVPLSAVFAGIQAADNRDPGGGIQVRLVFDKVLDSSIEMVTIDPTKAPGKTNTYTLMPGLVTLLDGQMMPVPSKMYYDNGGSSQFSADLELVPLGPAIVIKPQASLDAATTYTVKIGNPGALKDREGNAAVGPNGTALPTTLTFKTENLTPDVAGAFGGGLDYPDFSKPATIAPNEVIQIGFYENIAGDTATVTVTTGPAAAKPIAFSERGSDPAMCTTAASGDPSGPVLDITNTDTGSVMTGKPVDWPAGDYTIHVKVQDINGLSTFESDYMFTVAGTDQTDPMADPNIQGNHVTPFQCMM